MDIEKSRKLLQLANVFYGDYDDEPEAAQTLNMNDTFGWALAWGEYVPDEELPEVARLFVWYGFNGLHYWVSERNQKMDSDFFDVTRGIQFVRCEEELKNKIESCSQRAYTNIKYKLGSSHIKVFIKRMRMKLFWRKIALRKHKKKLNE